jgi:hypothetical protein
MEKKLLITLDEHDIPNFEFVGDWRGKDVLIISRLLRREYVKYQRKVKKQNLKEDVNERSSETS